LPTQDVASGQATPLICRKAVWLALLGGAFLANQTAIHARLSMDTKELLRKPPVLITESADELNGISAALEQEVKPCGVVEVMRVHEIGCIVWEIQRLRRAKANIINAAFRPALEVILKELLRNPETLREWVTCDEAWKACVVKANTLARQWFIDEEAQQQVLDLLEQFGLDESCIESEAMRRVSEDLERFDRMESSLEARRNKALGCIAEYRLAQQLRESSARMIEARLEDGTTKESAGA
jgi:hypothetical protein